jgi:hypothetical protein
VKPIQKVTDRSKRLLAEAGNRAGFPGGEGYPPPPGMFLEQRTNAGPIATS